MGHPQLGGPSSGNLSVAIHALFGLLGMHGVLHQRNSHQASGLQRRNA